MKTAFLDYILFPRGNFFNFSKNRQSWDMVRYQRRRKSMPVSVRVTEAPRIKFMCRKSYNMADVMKDNWNQTGIDGGFHISRVLPRNRIKSSLFPPPFSFSMAVVIKHRLRTAFRTIFHLLPSPFLTHISCTVRFITLNEAARRTNISAMKR